mmetsp:Transcript_12228/g.29807  ORF Transcript_12228/g.29807 Transcript_12228/m.29807 type:complete len:204 (-) Transcript_12228:598-1209(-)
MAAFKETRAQAVLEFLSTSHDGHGKIKVTISRHDMPTWLQDSGMSEETWALFVRELTKLCDQHPMNGKRARHSSITGFRLFSALRFSCRDEEEVDTTRWLAALSQTLTVFAMVFYCHGTALHVKDDAAAQRCCVIVEQVPPQPSYRPSWGGSSVASAAERPPSSLSVASGSPPRASDGRRSRDSGRSSVRDSAVSVKLPTITD